MTKKIDSPIDSQISYAIFAWAIITPLQFTVIYLLLFIYYYLLLFIYILMIFTDLKLKITNHKQCKIKKEIISSP